MVLVLKKSGGSYGIPWTWNVTNHLSHNSGHIWKGSAPLYLSSTYGRSNIAYPYCIFRLWNHIKDIGGMVLDTFDINMYISW